MYGFLKSEESMSRKKRSQQFSSYREVQDKCGGCFLYERRGVCHMARDAYGLQNSPETGQVERIRKAIIEEAETVLSLPELVRLDTQRAISARSDRRTSRGSVPI